MSRISNSALLPGAGSEARDKLETRLTEEVDKLTSIDKVATFFTAVENIG